jgi:aryl-alcohol dehydrogenase-like predicted oxidoreductase
VSVAEGTDTAKAAALWWVRAHPFQAAKLASVAARHPQRTRQAVSMAQVALAAAAAYADARDRRARRARRRAFLAVTSLTVAGAAAYAVRRRCAP